MKPDRVPNQKTCFCRRLHFKVIYHDHTEQSDNIVGVQISSTQFLTDGIFLGRHLLPDVLPKLSSVKHRQKEISKADELEHFGCPS